MLWYLSKVPVNPHSFLHGLFAVVETRLDLVFAGVSQTAVVIVYVGLDAANVQLTSRSIISVLKIISIKIQIGTTGTNNIFDYHLTCDNQSSTIFSSFTYLGSVVVAVKGDRCVTWHWTLVQAQV